MSNLIDYLYFNFLYEPFIYLLGIFVNERYGIFILIGIIVIISIIQGKLKISGKIRYLSKLLNLLMPILVILLMAASYVKYGPSITAFLKSSSSQKTQTTSPSPSKKDGSGTQNNSSQQNAPTYQAPKQLYYAVSCSSCWNEACPRNGYSYGGYNESLYYYYRTLCQNCRCNNYRAQSLWR